MGPRHLQTALRTLLPGPIFSNHSWLLTVSQQNKVKRGHMTHGVTAVYSNCKPLSVTCAPTLEKGSSVHVQSLPCKPWPVGTANTSTEGLQHPALGLRTGHSTQLARACTPHVVLLLGLSDLNRICLCHSRGQVRTSVGVFKPRVRLHASRHTSATSHNPMSQSLGSATLPQTAPFFP